MSIYQRDPAAPGANVGRPRLHPQDRLEHAVVRFNASSAARTVAGLTRSLGAPSVSIGAAAGSAGEVRITVAWDLCWYQWGVDLDDPQQPVSEIANGTEVEQLDRSARLWNAAVEEGAGIVFGAAVSPRRVRRGRWLRRR